MQYNATPKRVTEGDATYLAWFTIKSSGTRQRLYIELSSEFAARLRDDPVEKERWMTSVKEAIRALGGERGDITFDFNPSGNVAVDVYSKEPIGEEELKGAVTSTFGVKDVTVS